MNTNVIDKYVSPALLSARPILWVGPPPVAAPLGRALPPAPLLAADEFVH